MARHARWLGTGGSLPHEAVAPLTPRQLEVLRTYAELGDYLATAHKLGITRATVNATLVSVRQRLGVQTTVQAVWLVFGRAA